MHHFWRRFLFLSILCTKFSQSLNMAELFILGSDANTLIWLVIYFDAKMLQQQCHPNCIKGPTYHNASWSSFTLVSSFKIRSVLNFASVLQKVFWMSLSREQTVGSQSFFLLSLLQPGELSPVVLCAWTFNQETDFMK